MENSCFCSVTYVHLALVFNYFPVPIGTRIWGCRVKGSVIFSHPLPPRGVQYPCSFLYWSLPFIAGLLLECLPVSLWTTLVSQPKPFLQLTLPRNPIAYSFKCFLISFALNPFIAWLCFLEMGRADQDLFDSCCE